MLHRILCDLTHFNQYFLKDLQIEKIAIYFDLPRWHFSTVFIISYIYHIVNRCQYTRTIFKSFPTALLYCKIKRSQSRSSYNVYWYSGWWLRHVSTIAWKSVERFFVLKHWKICFGIDIYEVIHVESLDALFRKKRPHSIFHNLKNWKDPNQ